MKTPAKPFKIIHINCLILIKQRIERVLYKNENKNLKCCAILGYNNSIQSTIQSLLWFEYNQLHTLLHLQKTEINFVSWTILFRLCWESQIKRKSESQR